MALPPPTTKKPGIAPGSCRDSWKAARKSLSKEERRAARVEKKEYYKARRWSKSNGI
jgi:hypothetical protein